MATIKLIKKIRPISDDAQALSHMATIEEIATWQEVLDCYFELKLKFAPKRIFLVLDNEPQANYTSMHATTSEVFQNDAGDILDNLAADDPTLDEIIEGQVIPNEIAYYAKQLQNREHHVAIGSFNDKMRFFSSADCQAMVKFNQSPLPVMDVPMVVKAGNFDSEPLKLALLPNGYFTCDFDPFENFAIITMMDGYGFEFIGLGASLLGFVKTEHFRIEALPDLLSKLTQLYHLDASTQPILSNLFSKNNYALLPYIESPCELY